LGATRSTEFGDTWFMLAPRSSVSVAHTRGGAGALWAVAIVMAVVLYAILKDLSGYHGNWTGFIHFGADYAAGTHPPPGAIVLHGANAQGDDGQFYYLVAQDPLHAHLAGLSGQTFRALRVGYPLLVSVVSSVIGASVPVTLVVVNVIVVLAVSAGFAYYALRQGWSPWWALVLGLLPGFLTATLHDLTDPLSVALVLAGLLAWTHQRRWSAAILLIGAVLTREADVVALAAVFLDQVLRSWRSERGPGSFRRFLRKVSPILLPAAIFLGWLTNLILRTHGPIPEASHTFPFDTFVADARYARDLAYRGQTYWALTYEAIMVVMVLLAFWAVVRCPDALSFAAVGFVLALSIGIFAPIWSDARDSLPVLSLLLVIGLRDGRQLNLGVAVAAALMTPVLLVLPGVLA
jgi:hypothetical protein